MGNFISKNFKLISEIIGGGILILAGIAFFALLGGTLVYWMWPHVIPVVLPGAVAAGTIAGTLGWWKAILLTWLCGLLFKGSTSNGSKNKNKNEKK